MSDTPRTDAFAEQMFTKHDPLIAYKSAGVAEINDWENFARQLERELGIMRRNWERSDLENDSLERDLAQANMDYAEEHREHMITVDAALAMKRELAAAQAKVLVYDPDSAWHDWRVKNPDNTMYEAFKAGYYAAIKEKP